MEERPGLRSIVVDCVRPAALARFWVFALRWSVRPYSNEDLAWLAERGLTPETDPSVCIEPPNPSLPTMWFVSVPEPKVGKVRIHVDVNVPPGGIDGLLEHGARIVEAHPDGQRWTIMADPEGNEFCAFEIDTGG